MKFVKMADFYLRDDTLVFGKLVSETKNKITVEHLDGSRLVVSTYSKRTIDTRTLHTKTIPESKYYMELAEHFSSKTWDFRDDPDDFIQAIRCCEKAKQSLTSTQKQNPEKVSEIDKKIKQLQADRKVWAREVESRAKLKKLEFEATIETRIKELEDKVAAGSQKVDKIATDMKDNQQKFEKDISGINGVLSRRLEILENRMESNRRIIERINGVWYYSPRYYHYPYDRRGYIR